MSLKRKAWTSICGEKGNNLVLTVLVSFCCSEKKWAKNKHFTPYPPHFVIDVPTNNPSPQFLTIFPEYFPQIVDKSAFSLQLSHKKINQHPKDL